MATLDFGDEAAIALAEADQRAALFLDVLHRQPRATTVAPRIARERIEDARRCDVTDALEVLEQRALLREDLRLRREMLQRAAAAGAEMRAFGRDAIGRGDDHFERFRLVELATALHDARLHALARERTRDEHGLAFHARDTAAVVAQVDDVQLDFRHGTAVHSKPSRNCASDGDSENCTRSGSKYSTGTSSTVPPAIPHPALPSSHGASPSTWSM